MKQIKRNKNYPLDNFGGTAVISFEGLKHDAGNDWIVAIRGGTAVISFEGLKLENQIESGKGITGGTAVISFEGLKLL